MIAQNPIQSRQVKRKIQRQQAKHGKSNMQHALNTVLWEIVIKNGGSISVPCSQLKNLPANIALEAKVDSKTDMLVIVAGTQEAKSDIILPNNGIIT